MTFSKARVHQLYNLLVNFVANLQLPKHAEPVCLLSGAPFLNCTYHECTLSQSVQAGEGNMFYRVDGCVFAEGMKDLARQVLARSPDSRLKFEADPLSEAVNQAGSAPPLLVKAVKRAAEAEMFQVMS